MINDNTPSPFMWNKIGIANELYEGSADSFLTINSLSPVKFTSVSRDTLPDSNGVSELHSASGRYCSFLFCLCLLHSSKGHYYICDL